MYTCQQAILAALEGRGALHADELKFDYCRVEADDYSSYAFRSAIYALLASGAIVRADTMDDSYELA